MTEIEAWLKNHTFQCSIGRVTPDQCRALRSRATIKECSEKAWPAVPPMPQVCERCCEWEEKIMSVEGTERTKQSPIETKKCRRCGRDLPLTEYHKDGKGLGGRKSICKDCLAMFRKEKATNVIDKCGLDVPESTDTYSTQTTWHVTIDFEDYNDLLKYLKKVMEMPTSLHSVSIVPARRGGPSEVLSIKS